MESDLHFGILIRSNVLKFAREMSEGHAGSYWAGGPLFAQS
jgi:hypothetical protein